MEMISTQVNTFLDVVLTIPVSALAIATAFGYALIGLVTIINMVTKRLARKNFQGFGAVALIFTTSGAFFSQIWADSPLYSLFLFINLITLILIFIFARKLRFIIASYDAIKNSKKQMEQQERWLRLMHEHMTDGLAVYSPLGNLLYINEAGLRLFGLKEYQLNSKQNDITLFNHLNTIDDAVSLQQKVLQGESINTKINLPSVHSGETRVIEVTLSPVQAGVDRTIAMVACYRDVTEFHNLERAKEEFIQIASHELRTPLTAVRGFLSLLQMNKYGKLTPKQKDLLTKAQQASVRLSELVDNLLLVNRIKQSEAELKLESTNISHLILEIIQELAGEADHRKISLRLLEPKTPIPSILADKEKLYHIFSNLITNAIKYTPEGGYVFVEPRFKNGQVEIQVADTGIGIKKEDINRLFKKFERLDNPQTTKVNGSGLGLVIVKSFTEMHGGKVTVSSRVGHGSAFTVSLPVNKSFNYGT